MADNNSAGIGVEDLDKLPAFHKREIISLLNSGDVAAARRKMMRLRGLVEAGDIEVTEEFGKNLGVKRYTKIDEDKLEAALAKRVETASATTSMLTPTAPPKKFDLLGRISAFIKERAGVPKASEDAIQDAKDEEDAARTALKNFRAKRSEVSK